ncbi:AraC family transcriptional regulator [Staphylococcus succinus]|jgi:AraC-like DNA-binding protein|nr:AraC family transcriptional regulator [Staphylococcus succinus]
MIILAINIGGIHKLGKLIKHNSYGFRFKGDYQDKVAGLNAVGYELRKTHDYCWHGCKRGEKDIYIFQYTLKGKGSIQIEHETFNLEPEDAFLVHVPSNHCYYLPKDSNEWEFLYFTIYGKVAAELFHRIMDTYGQILKLSIHSEPIKHIIDTLEKLETFGINHGYEASSCAYTFIMKCLEHVEYGHQQANDFPLPIVKAIQFIEKYYHEDISLDDIVKASDLSKYHFTRQFGIIVKETPIHYLTKTRIKQALLLLSSNEKNIECISREVGYTSSNYFSKVFKRIVGVSPNRYRKEKTIMSVNKIFID